MTREATVAPSGQNRSMPPVGGADGANRPSWLLCRAGAVLCALPIEHVIEIMRLLPMEQIAGAPKYVRGLSVIRGAPVPIVDLGVIVGDQTTRPKRLIAVKAGKRTVALAAEAIIGITTIAADAFGQLPPLLRDAATDTIAAIGALDTELIVCLRAARLVPEEALAQLDPEEATS